MCRIYTSPATHIAHQIPRQPAESLGDIIGNQWNDETAPHGAVLLAKQDAAHAA
jgi:hypothetical protein